MLISGEKYFHEVLISAICNGVGLAGEGKIISLQTARRGLLLRSCDLSDKYG